MTMVTATIVDGDREMVLYPRDDLVLMGVNPGSPQIRAVVEPRPNSDGVIDTTQFYGARVVAVELMSIETPAAMVDELTAFTHPAARPYLVISDDEWAQDRRLRLRVESWSAPQLATQSPTIRNMQAQWSAPDGAWESVDAIEPIVTADLPATIGFTFPVTFPVTLDPTTATGALLVTNRGNTPSDWTARLYGPCTAPVLINNLTGQRIAFTESLVLTAGQYVEVDSQAHTAYLNSDTSLSQLVYLDFSVSSWWQIQPGTQQIRYAPTGPSPGSQAELTYRYRWL